MSTTTQYVPHDYRRICDECGALFNRSRLHRKMQWILCDTCDQPGDRIREQEDAAIARQRPFRILPVPNAKPQDYNNPYAWTAEEAQVFNFVLATAPARTVGGAPNPGTAGFAAAYLADIVTQGLRPPAWQASCLSKIATLSSYLLTQQVGSSTGPAAAVTDPRYGGFLVSGAYSTAIVISAGLAFIKGYVVLGNPAYLAAANRCGTFLRHVQCGDIQATKHTVYPASGSPYHTGGLDSSVDDSTGLQSGVFLAADGYALVFLEALAAVIGSSATYGDAASTAAFSAPTLATLATMTSELAAFLGAGPFDSAHNAAPTSPLSPTAPRSSYSAFLSDGSGTGSWGAPATVPGDQIAQAIAGLFAANGADAVVTLMMQWLAAVTPNPANATPVTSSPQQILDGITGVYSPATAPATFLTTSVPFTEATGALYNLAALGLLAPVLAATNVAALRAARAAVSSAVPYSVLDAAPRYLGPLGRAGLSLQPHSTATTTAQDVGWAAEFGAVYRYAIP